MKYLSALLVVIIFISASAQVQHNEKVVAPGVIYKKIINVTDTLSIDILKIDLSNNNYFLRTVKAKNLLKEKETTSSMVKALSDSGYNVIAAVNADFFEKDGDLINNMISEGKIIKAVRFSDSPFNPFVSSQFAVTENGKLAIEQFVFTGDLILPDGSIEKINRINSYPDSNSIMLYNSFQGEQTPIAPNNWNVIETNLVPVKKSNDTSIFIVSAPFQQGGNCKINGNEFVLSANGHYSYYLEREIKVGDTIKTVIKFNPHISNLRSLVGGWPRLVVDGKSMLKTNQSLEGVFPRFSKNRHPRTGIGFSKDSTTIFFITIDGRQKSSRGMNLEEFADLMIDEGVYQGLNFDGGGSTTMIVDNQIVNSPSDETGERAVGNCLVLIKK